MKTPDTLAQLQASGLPLNRTFFLHALGLVFALGLTGCAHEAAVSSRPDATAEICYRRGIAKLESGYYKDSAQEFANALDVEPDYFAAWAGLRLARAYWWDFGNKKRAIRQAQLVMPHEPFVWVFGGRYWLDQRDQQAGALAKAEEALKEALSLDPDYEAAIFYLGMAYYYGRKYATAEAHFVRVEGFDGQLAAKAREMRALLQTSPTDDTLP